MRTFTPHLTSLLAVFALLLCGCSQFEPAEQDLGIAYDAEADVLTFTIDSRGIHAPSGRASNPFGKPPTQEKQTAAASERLRAAAEGAPYFVLLASPLALDLTEVPEAIARDGQDEDWKDIQELWLDLRKGIRVDSSGLYLDTSQEVGLYQRVRVENAHKLVGFMNELISRSLLETDLDDDANAREVAADKVRRAYARERGPWVVLDAEALEVRMPLAPWQVANMMKGIAELPFEPVGEEADPWEAELGAAMGRALFADLGAFQVVDGIARLRYPFGDDQRIDFPYARMRASEPAALLREALAEDGLEALDREQVQAKLGVVR